MPVYVGIDVHRKRSQVAVVDQAGVVLANRNVPNGVAAILKVIGQTPIGTPVAFEAAFGWGWLVAMLEDYGFAPHLVHPLRCKAIASARLKNDKVDAATLAQLPRADLLPEAWIAPPAVRQLRALVRHRVALVRLRTQLRNRRSRPGSLEQLLDRSRPALAGRPAAGVAAEATPPCGRDPTREALPGQIAGALGGRPLTPLGAAAHNTGRQGQEQVRGDDVE